MVAHLLESYHITWSTTLSRILCGELIAVEQQIMQRSCPVWKQHQQHQQQLQQLQGSAKKSAATVRAAAALVLLGNNSIMLQQLLTTAAAAGGGGSSHQQQQQQLADAVLYWADASGGVLSSLVSDILSNGAITIGWPGQPGADGCLAVFSKQCCCVLAGALQAFEAAVRYCVAAGSSTTASGSCSGSASGSGSLVVPPSIADLEASIVGVYPHLVQHEYGSNKCVQGLLCSQHKLQLLQSVLSMLLTSAKVWQMELQPPMCLKLMGSVAMGPAICKMIAEQQQPGACSADAPAATAAAAALREVSGAAQVAHLISRQLSCLEQQLRRWVDAGDAAAAADWLLAVSPTQQSTARAAAAAAADASYAPIGVGVPSSSAPVGASCPGLREPCSQLEGIASLVFESSQLVEWAAESDGLSLEAVRKLVDVFMDVKFKIDRMGKDVLGGKAGGLSAGMPDERTQQKQAALLGELRALADALQGYGPALAAAVPSRFGCNWPGCVRLLGVSEGYGLVRGQACVCGGCRQAR
jgi:hypothetical protein